MIGGAGSHREGGHLRGAGREDDGGGGLAGEGLVELVEELGGHPFGFLVDAGADVPGVAGEEDLVAGVGVSA